MELLLHDLEDPMLVIETGARALLDRREKFGDLSPQQERTLKRILRNALRGRGMLSILFEVGRSESGRFMFASFAPVRAIHASLMETIEIMDTDLFECLSRQANEDEQRACLEAAGIVIDAASYLTDEEIVQDETIFSEIIGNLLKNALRFRKQKLLIAVARDTDTLHVSIDDDGPGIEPGHQQLIFQPFANTETMASLARRDRAFGLAAARILARRLGGDITVESEIGNGATFRLTIPINIEPDDRG